MNPDRLAILRESGVYAVAARLGIESRGETLATCPACGATQRGAKDRRAPIKVVREGRGWVCWACDARGDAVTLAAYRMTGEAKPATWGPVLDLVERDVAMPPLPPRRLTARERRERDAAEAWAGVLAGAEVMVMLGLDFSDALPVWLALEARAAGWPDAFGAAREYVEARGVV